MFTSLVNVSPLLTIFTDYNLKIEKNTKKISSKTSTIKNKKLSSKNLKIVFALFC
jgi:hypothetical protein